MEDQNKKPKKPIAEIMPTEKVSFKDRLRNNKKPLIIVGVVLLVAALAIGAWFLFLKKKEPLTPEQTLESLKESSVEVITSSDQRIQELEDANKRATPSKLNTDDRRNMLNALK